MMEGRFEVTVRDRKTGQLAEYGGMKANVRTDFGILCCMSGSDDNGTAFLCELLGNDEGGVNLNQIHNLFKAVFHLFGEIAACSGNESAVHAAISSAFLQFLTDAHGEKKAAFILHGLSLIPGLAAEQEG